MRKLHFYGLPRSLQDRFIESSRGAAVPAPLLVRRKRSLAHVRWFGAGLLTALGWAAFVGNGFGELEHPLALAGPQWLLVHATFAAVTVACLLRGQALRWESQRTPYPEGTYLFPAALIDARPGQLIEHDVANLSDVSVQGSSVRLQFAGRSGFSFDAGSPDLAEHARVALEQGREQWNRVQGEDARLEKARLSPLVDSGVPNPLASTAPLVNQQFLKPAAFGIITLLSAAMLAWAVWWWRNELSEKTLYVRATSENTVEAYDAYLARGGKRPDVVDVLLPRARLDAARTVGSVEAIRQYIAQNPETKIASEVQDALRAALLLALEKAKAKGTVTALGEFERTHPDHGLVSKELGAARRQVYRQVAADFEKKASPKHPQLLPFVKQLLAYVEKHGPRVEVRMEHLFPQKLETLDNVLSKSPKYYMGQRSLPTQYFLGEHAARREKMLAESIIERLQVSFPEDVLKLHFTGPAEDINQPLPAITVPTLTLSHVEKLSGGFVGGKPKSIFLGASVGVTATFEIPDQEPAFVYKWGKWAPPNLRKLEESDKLVPDVMPDVYDDMIGSAFEKFADDYLKNWYAEPAN